MRWAIPPGEPPAVAVSDGSRFPVRRIWCVGRKYRAHALEMGGDPAREPPFFFSKPADAVVGSGTTLPFPPATDELHHEVELAVAIGGHGAHVPAGHGQDLIFGYAVALDMTRRDRQAEAKAAARPWEIAKAFDQSCPIGTIRPAASIAHPRSGALLLSVNGLNRQRGNIADMIWSPGECIEALSASVELRPGDLLLTGTPAGVGRVNPGDTLVASCEGIGDLTLSYGQPEV